MKTVRSKYNKHSPLMNLNTARWIEKRQGKSLYVEVDEMEQEGLKVLFNDLDEDKNGSIEFAELRNMMKSMKINKRGIRNLKNAFSRFDTNGNGAMSYEEFEDMMTYSKRPNASQDESQYTKVFTEVAVAYRRKKLESKIADQSLSGTTRFKDMLTLMSVNYVNGNEDTDAARWKDAEKMYQAKAIKQVDVQRSQTAAKGLRRPLKSSHSMPMLTPENQGQPSTGVPAREMVHVREQVFQDVWGPHQTFPLSMYSSSCGQQEQRERGVLQDTSTNPELNLPRQIPFKKTKAWSSSDQLNKSVKVNAKQTINEGPYEFNHKAMNPPFSSKQNYTTEDFHKEQNRRRHLTTIEPTLTTRTATPLSPSTSAPFMTYAQASWAPHSQSQRVNTSPLKTIAVPGKQKGLPPRSRGQTNPSKTLRTSKRHAVQVGKAMQQRQQIEKGYKTIQLPPCHHQMRPVTAKI